jgi:uncharacterized protein (TIGR02391 family)
MNAIMLIPHLLPYKLTLAGIDDLYIRLGAEKAWLGKGGPRLWEGDKQHRVRQWVEGINKYRPELTFPIALEVLKILVDSNPAIPAKERQVAINLAKKIEVRLGIMPPPTAAPPPRLFDQRVVNVARDAYVAGSYTEAVRRAYVELINEVKARAETPPDLDGVDLMNRVFSRGKHLLRVSDDPAQQEGYMNLFKGAVSVFRNPPSHSNKISIDQNEADDLLSFASYLFRVIDGSTRTTPSGP